MTKEQWIEHIEKTCNVERPRPAINALGGTWKEAVAYHRLIQPNCPDCKARRKTRRANNNRKDREECYKSAGLTKVYGAVSGNIYWE